MCETRSPSTSDARIHVRRGVKAQWAALLTLGAVALVAGLLGLGPRHGNPGPDARAADRVFRRDMALQLADARRLVRRAGGHSGLGRLALAIQRNDAVAVGSSLRVPGRSIGGGAAASAPLRHALRRHVQADRIIATVALGARSDAAVRRAAVRLQALTRRWTDALRREASYPRHSQRRPI